MLPWYWVTEENLSCLSKHASSSVLCVRPTQKCHRLTKDLEIFLAFAIFCGDKYVKEFLSSVLFLPSILCEIYQQEGWLPKRGKKHFHSSQVWCGMAVLVLPPEPALWRVMTLRQWDQLHSSCSWAMSEYSHCPHTVFVSCE